MKKNTLPILSSFGKADYTSGIHRIRIEASDEHIFQAIRTLGVGEVPLMKPLFFLRSLPALISGKGTFFTKHSTTVLAGMERQGFKVLTESPRELTFGVMGKFWQAQKWDAYVPDSLSAFKEDPPEGYAKAIGYFGLDKLSGDLLHETCIYTPDPKVRKRFGRYWSLISLGAKCLRWSWLKAIKRKAEALEKNFTDRP